MAPLAADHKKVVADLNIKNAERLTLNIKLQNLIKDSKKDPNAENLAKLKSLRSRLIETHAQLQTSTADLIVPRDMPKILETVLHKTGGLTLVKLKSLGVQPLFVEEDQDAKGKKPSLQQDNKKLTADNIDNAYRHGVRIELKGDYLTILSYLKSLEELEWSFFWDNFEFQISEYPEANAAVEISTLSLQQEWIGV